jgi:phytoene dehydrogenase-like protein
MSKSDNQIYDAVIIGAGLSGLVCGCYLAKAGMKVLIAEQHYKPGGYCTSFKRQGFTFDAAAHSFGGYREAGIVKRVFKDLGIDNRINVKRSDPTDIIKAPDYEIIISADFDETIKNLQHVFPEESRSIRDFFSALMNSDPSSFARIRHWTFKKLLDNYFQNNRLKSILSFPIYGNTGLPPSLLSAYVGITIVVEFLLDGGYYPTGGMQVIPDTLVEKFKEFGGELILSSKVNEITVEDGRSVGVVLGKNGFIPSKYVVAGCDARQTYLTLFKRASLKQDYVNKIKNMVPSLSMFIVYIGLDRTANQMTNSGINLWLMSDYDLENIYLSAQKTNINDTGSYLIHVSSDKKSIIGYKNVAFKNKSFWLKNKNEISESFIKKIEKDVFPGLSEYIVYKEAATPYTLYRYTLNYAGASYGWACTPSQVADTYLKKPPFISNFYLTGHWTTSGLGIPGVIYTGYQTATVIAKRYGK